jgi:excisionase family DNA binding protein
MGTEGAPLYLTTGTAARRLGLGRNTLLRAVRRGDVQPAFHTPGGDLRFREADIAAYATRLVATTPLAKSEIAGAGAVVDPTSVPPDRAVSRHDRHGGHGRLFHVGQPRLQPHPWVGDQ